MKVSNVVRIPFALTVLAFACTGHLAAQPKEPKAAGKPLAGYQAVVVERFTVDKVRVTEEFPRGGEIGIQQNVVDRLMKEKAFARVIDALTEQPSPEPAQESARRVILSGTVVKYDKGSRAARYWIGFGTGATKVKVRFVFRDAETGAELLRSDREGRFYGTWSAFGGGAKEGTQEAAGDVVDRLVEDIRKNR